MTVDHAEALEALDLLVRALWDTHTFLVDGEPVGDRGAVIEAFRRDQGVSFVRDSFK